MSEELKPVNQRISLYGPGGDAWKVDLAAAGKAHDGPLFFTTMWLVTAKHYHPLFHSYVIEVTDMHQYQAHFQEELQYYVPGARYELHVFSLVPEIDRNEFLRTAGASQKIDGGPLTAVRLSPVNYAQQFNMSEADVKAMVVRDVLLVVGGNLNPDSDGSRQWIALHGDDCVRN